MSPQVTEIIRFGELTLDVRGRRVLRDGARLAMGPMEVKLLQVLLQHRGKVLTGDELRILVWSDDPNSGVVPAGDANALYVSIRKLRAALGDHGRFILNIPKVGYTVSEEVAGSPDPVVHDNSADEDSLFVGRDKEVEAARRAIKTTRVLTITGPPGIGKSHLATEAARALKSDFGEDVYLIDLVTIDDGQFVAKAVMSVLELPESPGQDVEQELVAVLKGRSALLVFDNCEHVIDAAAPLIRAISRSAPNVRILATSREPLHVTGETVIPIGPLPVPPVEDNSKRPVTEYPSVDLFIRLAKQRRPDIELSEPAIQKVAELCRRLEGIPIAIELAAAQVDAYTIDQILAAMSDRFRLLRRRGYEDARHETLEGAIDWSYGLLSDDERLLLRRLSVLTGGWTAETALAICGTEGQTGADMVHLLAGLVRRSLIQLSLTKQRYGMLEMIRQFGRSRLREANEDEELLRRRTEYFVDLAERSFDDGDRGEWPAILRAEYDNIRPVLRRTIIDNVDPVSGLRLCGNLNRFWFYNGFINEALQWTDLALANDDGSDPAARGRALTSAGFFFGQMPGAKGDAIKRRSYFEESIEIWRRLGDQKNLGVTLIGYSYMLNRMGEYDDAINAAREALETFRKTDFHFQTARAANNLALTYLDVGSFELAKPLLEEALADARLSDDTFLEAICLHNLAELAIHTADFKSAAGLLDQCFTAAQELHRRPIVAKTLLLKGELKAATGEFAPAIRTQQEALKEFDEMQDNQSIGSALETLASTLASRQRDLSLAAELMSVAEALRAQLDVRVSPARKVKLDQVLETIRIGLGDAAFEKAFERGKRIPLKKAIAASLALDFDNEGRDES